MHETDTARAVANPRRTRLGADWTSSRSGEVADRSRQTPGPDPEGGERSVG
ncbi:hypothetical protein FHX81_2204 [Saccharothrix saharensis]|uniref:Uncharacterized protein n=1 Tax=Saccharothrix saharensis TaxID=571190 RepID=A0A543JAN3_9PSEU|nr:hypothetical protein [Saccharothrix saharensis]TQM79892.1 hypothetical protein FHX81_2204 [Saccharothrix saharensis]